MFGDLWDLYHKELTLPGVEVSGGCAEKAGSEKQKKTQNSIVSPKLKEECILRKNGMWCVELPAEAPHRPDATKQMPHSFSTESNSYSSEL